MLSVRFLVAIVTMLSIIPAEPVYTGENITVDHLPQSVVDALKKQFPGAELREAERNEEQGQLIYEVDISVNGTKKEVEVASEGKIVEVGTGD